MAGRTQGARADATSLAIIGAGALGHEHLRVLHLAGVTEHDDAPAGTQLRVELVDAGVVAHDRGTGRLRRVEREVGAAEPVVDGFAQAGGGDRGDGYAGRVGAVGGA